MSDLHAVYICLIRNRNHCNITGSRSCATFMASFNQRKAHRIIILSINFCGRKLFKFVHEIRILSHFARFLFISRATDQSDVSEIFGWRTNASWNSYTRCSARARIKWNRKSTALIQFVNENRHNNAVNQQI